MALVANPDVSLSLYLPSFRVPGTESSDTAYVDENGVMLLSGGDANQAYQSTPVPAATLKTDLFNLEHLVPQTVTLAYVNVHLVSGMTVDINSDFSTADNNYNDFAFADLYGSSGSSQAMLLGDGTRFSQFYNTKTNGLDKLVALFTGIHTGQHFTVDHTDDYTLVLGIADVGDKTGQSVVNFSDVSFGLPQNSYSVSVPDLGLLLSDGTVFNIAGLEFAYGKPVATNNVVTVLSPDSTGLIQAFYGATLTAQIGQEALRQTLADSANTGDLLNTSGGGDINLQAGGIASQTTLVTVPGSGLVAINAGALIGQDGAGLVAAGGGNIVAAGGGNIVAAGGGNIVAAGGGNIIASGGGNLVKQSGASIFEAGGGNIVAAGGGNIIAAGGGNIIASGGGNLAASQGTAIFTYNNSAGDLATDSTGNAATGVAFATTSTVRSYTLTADPAQTPAPPPIAQAERLISPMLDTTTIDSFPAIAGLSNGKYVTVWAAMSSASGNITEIKGQMLNADDTPFGTVFTISTPDNFDQTRPSVTGLANGQFVVSWTDQHLELSADGHETISTDVRAQFYNANGTANGPATTVNNDIVGPQLQSNAASLVGGGAVVVFMSAVFAGQTDFQYQRQVFAQRYDANGTAVGTNIVVGTSPSTYNITPAAAGLQDGGFVVAFAELFSDAPDTDGAIFFQRFDASGTSTGAAVRANTTTAGQQDSPSIVTLSDGSFVIAWQTEPVDNRSSSATIAAQRFTAAGAPLGGEVTVTTAALAYGATPAITATHNGGYTIAWDAPGQNPAVGFPVHGVQGQVFSADGTKQGGVFYVTPNSQFYQVNGFSAPAATTLADDRLVFVGGMNNAQNYSDIRAETFTLPTAGVSPTTDGRIIDGVISGATVFADANGNGVYDVGEAKATTDANGRYTFTTPASGVVIATGGVDQYTHLPFKGTLTGPAGSLAITALSTLVQKIMASNTVSVAEASLRVALALGLSLKTDLTSFNPTAKVLNGVADAGKALVADAVVYNTIVLAQAAGATGDLLGKLATQIGAASYGVVDPTSASTMQALGLDPITAQTVSTLAKAGANLLAQKLASDTPLSLVLDAVGVSTLQQGAEAKDLSAAGGNTTPVVSRYSGTNLAAQVDAAAKSVAGTPFDLSYVDVSTNSFGNLTGDSYVGPVAGLAKQYIWTSTDKVNIAARTSNVFLHGGPGDDALLVTGGTNVLDGGGGSNFLIGATGTGVDTFYVDSRGGNVTWSSIVNFHQGDMATLWGFHAGSTQAYTENEGAVGYTGLTLHSELGGAGTGVNASLTLTGISQATANAHFTITTGTTAPTGLLPAADYLLIKYDH